MCGSRHGAFSNIVTLAKYADSMYHYCTNALARTPTSCVSVLKSYVRAMHVSAGARSFMKSSPGRFANAHLSSGFTAILFELSFASWIINYPIVSPFAANWHIGEFGGGVGGGGSRGGHKGGAVALGWGGHRGGD